MFDCYDQYINTDPYEYINDTDYSLALKYYSDSIASGKSIISKQHAEADYTRLYDYEGNGVVQIKIDNSRLRKYYAELKELYINDKLAKCKKEIANTIGMSIESISENLKNMKQEDIAKLVDLCKKILKNK